MSLTCVSITFDDFLEFTSITHNSTPEFVVFVKAIFCSFGDYWKNKKLLLQTQQIQELNYG